MCLYCSGSIHVTSGQKEHVNRKFGESPRCFPCTTFLKCDKTQELQSLQTSTGNSEDKRVKVSSSQDYESSELQLEYLAAEVVDQLLNSALNMVDGQSQANTCDHFNKSGDQTDCACTDRYCEGKVCRERLEGKKDKVQEGERGSGEEEKTDWFKKNWEVGSRGTDQENVIDICCHGACSHGSSLGLDDFKEFLRGTPGWKLFILWMDIARLQAIQSRERKNR